MSAETNTDRKDSWTNNPHTGLFILARKGKNGEIEYFLKDAELVTFGSYDENWSTDYGDVVPMADTEYLRNEIDKFQSVFTDMELFLAEIMIYPKSVTELIEGGAEGEITN